MNFVCNPPRFVNLQSRSIDLEVCNQNICQIKEKRIMISKTFVSKALSSLMIITQLLCGCSNPTKIKVKVSNRTLIITDTLKLSAYFDECGEFGGHREQIRIYKIEGTFPGDSLDTLGADFLIDTVKCASDNRKRIFSRMKTRILTGNDKRVILQYMGKLLVNALNETWHSNAGKVYKVKCEMPEIDISYVDDGQNWNGFHEMKNSVFGQN